MRKRILISALTVLLLCSGCAGEGNPYRVETVVWIPVNPTEAPVMQAETAPTETEETTETVEVPKTTENTKKPSSTGSFSGGYVSNGGKPSSGKDTGSGKNNTASKQTEPRETEQPGTEPPATEKVQSGFDISGYSVGSLEYGIQDQINGARGAESLPELVMDSRLCAIAGCRAYELALLWSHTRPDGRSFTTVLEDYGYGAGAVTELLVYGSGSGDAVQMVSQWLMSETHKEKLLSDGFSTVGIGIYRTNGITYVCCLLVG